MKTLTILILLTICSFNVNAQIKTNNDTLKLVHFFIKHNLMHELHILKPNLINKIAYQKNKYKTKQILYKYELNQHELNLYLLEQLINSK